jgi:hypothetical protein
MKWCSGEPFSRDCPGSDRHCLDHWLWLSSKDRNLTARRTSPLPIIESISQNAYSPELSGLRVDLHINCRAHARDDVEPPQSHNRSN